MNTKLTELRSMIDGALLANPNSRQAALKACQWRLRGPLGQFVGLDAGCRCSFVPESQAEVFDGRDNEQLKLATYETALGPLSVEILPCVR